MKTIVFIVCYLSALIAGITYMHLWWHVLIGMCFIAVLVLAYWSVMWWRVFTMRKQGYDNIHKMCRKLTCNE